jgi:hypothetical protein
MKNDPADSQPAKTEKRMFQGFRFFAKSGLYLLESRAGESERGNTYTRTRQHFAKNLLKYLTLFVLIAGTMIYRRQAQIMSTQADIMKPTLPAVEEQAAAADKAARTAQKLMELSERPWIKAKLEVGGPFTFEPSGYANFRGKLTLKNIGHSVATGINPQPWLILVRFDNDLLVKPIDELRKRCEFERTRKVRQEFALTSQILFPGDEGTWNFSASLSKQTIDSQSFSWPYRPGKYISPVLLGCIDYQSSFAPEHHQTGFIYDVAVFDQSQPLSHTFFIPVGKEIPQGQVVISKRERGDYAD